MTIKYLDSKRISLDTTATHTVNYSTQTGWTASNSRISITSGYAYMNNSGSQLGDYIHTPLGLTLSDTKWYVEFEYYNMGAVNLYPFILAAGTSTIWNSTQDMIGVGEENPNKLRIVSKDGGNSIQQEIAFTPTMSTNTSYYCTLSRNGQVITLKLYTDTARTVQFGSTITQTISGTVTGLTTMQHSGRSDGGGTSGYNFKVKGTKIYDGVTSAPTKPTNVQDNSILVEKDTAERYWFSEAVAPTFEDDFDYATQSLADAVWVPNTTNIDVNVSTDVLDINNVGTLTSNISCVCDLGTISDTKWVLRYKVNWSTLSVGERWAQTFVGLSDKNGTVAWDGSQDSISVLYNRWGLFKQQNSVGASMQDWLLGSDMTDMSVSTDYYVETIRDGTSVSYTAYSDSDYSVPVSGISGTVTLNGNPTGLKYFVIRNDTTSGTGTTAGIIDDFEFYNGVTAATPATWTNPVCSATISSTATMGSNGDFDVSYTTVASKTGSGQRGCNAWEFDGQSASPYTGRNAVKGATNSDFSVSSSTAFTIAAWVKLNTLGQQHTILGYSGAYTNTFWTNLGISAANKVEGHTATNGQSNNYIPTGNSLSVDTWHHCVFIHKADKTVTVYLDADTANKGTGTGDTGSASAGFWTIAGRWGYNVTIPTLPFLDGFIDQATLWDVALSEADVTTLYNGGRLTPPSVSQNNIKGYWTFSETSGGATNKAV